MNLITNAYPTIVAFIGIMDATIILVMGLLSAILYLTDYKAEVFWNRIWPATGVLIGTSIGAGIVFTITHWIVLKL